MPPLAELPSPDRCVLRYLLERHARERPASVFAVFTDGTRWTYAELLQRVRAAAAGLQRLGVRQGEHVLCWLPNGPEAILTWFGINYLGAVYVPLNTGYRGNLLAHAVQLSDARVMVVHAGLAERLQGLQTGALQTLAISGVPPAGLALPFACSDAAAI